MKPKLREIKACGTMVNIIDSKGSRLISRREALYRARAVAGMDEQAAELAEQLIKAADEAEKNDTGGTGYVAASVERFKQFIKIAAQERLGKGIQV